MAFSLYVALRACGAAEELLLGELSEDPELLFLGEGAALLQGALLGYGENKRTIPIHRDAQRLPAGTATHLKGEIVPYGKRLRALLHSGER
jgi:hypothetical protein